MKGYRNAEGYPDPTAYYGTKDIIEMEHKVSVLVHIFKDIAKLAGFEIVGRVTFRHLESGKEFR